MHNYFTNIYEARYVSGVVAGLKLNQMIEDGTITEDSCKMGYVGAFPYAEVISGYTSFYLGAKSVCPSVTMEVKYTNSWASFDLEKECAEVRAVFGATDVISILYPTQGTPAASHAVGAPVVSACWLIRTHPSEISASAHSFSRSKLAQLFVYFTSIVTDGHTLFAPR